MAVSSNTYALDTSASTWSLVKKDQIKHYAEGGLSNPREATSTVCRVAKEKGGQIQ